VEDHFEAFEGMYEERFERQYGFFRPYVKEVIYRYLDPGTPVPTLGAQDAFKKGKITQDMIALLDTWRHTGFNVYCGKRILPRQKTSNYGYYSNASRGQRKKAGIDGIIPCLLQPETTDIQFRKTWSRMIQKIYEVDPLTCPKCQGKMRVVAFIEDPDAVKKILKHLDLWNFKKPPRPVAHAPPMIVPIYDDAFQPSADDYVADTVYPMDAYF
jgi:hypothetical protein